MLICVSDVMSFEVWSSNSESVCPARVRWPASRGAQPQRDGNTTVREESFPECSLMERRGVTRIWTRYKIPCESHGFIHHCRFRLVHWGTWVHESLRENHLCCEFSELWLWCLLLFVELAHCILHNLHKTWRSVLDRLRSLRLCWLQL